MMFCELSNIDISAAQYWVMSMDTPAKSAQDKKPSNNTLFSTFTGEGTLPEEVQGHRRKSSQCSHDRLCHSEGDADVGRRDAR